MLKLLKPKPHNMSFPDYRIDAKYRLILGRNNKNNQLATVATSLLEISLLIKQARSNGKHVLILSGCYDLLHIGHLFYVEQCVQAFFEFNKCSREGIYLVILLDDDEMISHTKKHKLRTEPYPRPVVPLADRMNALKIFPVDLIGSLPFPKLQTEEIQTVKNINVELSSNEIDIFEEIKEETTNLLPEVNFTYTLSELEAEFTNELSVAIWHCRLFTYLMIESGGNNQNLPEVTRITSVHDTNYLLQVLWLSIVAGMSAHLIDDASIQSSTSAIVEAALREYGKNGWQFIKEYCKKST